MNEQAGHRWIVEEGWPVGHAREAILATPASAWARYDSPFERKSTLADKNEIAISGDLARLFSDLEHVVRDRASEAFGVRLLPDDQRHYAGVFMYGPGDHLGVHVDAGIHPATGLRKHVTAVLYFGGDGPLELWTGTRCATDWSKRTHQPPGPPSKYESTAGDDEPNHLHMPGDPSHSHPWVEAVGPAVDSIAEAIAPDAGRLVLFENADRAWHGTPVNTGDTDRIVVTVSYLSHEVDAFENKRQRAYFVPRPGEQWDAETYRLRDLRADAERYAEAYRAG